MVDRDLQPAATGPSEDVLGTVSTDSTAPDAVDLSETLAIMESRKVGPRALRSLCVCVCVCV